MNKLIKFLDLKSQYQSIKDEINLAINEVLNSGTFIGGEYVASFESNFSRFIGTKHCIGVANGTDALEIAIQALNLKPNSEIIVPFNSFIATSEAVSRNGHKIIFCDIDYDDYTISIKDLKEKITINTGAIIAVHLYGHPCNMYEINKIAKLNNLFVIEDCAQSHGAEFRGIKTGNLSDIACFSFYPGKNLGAYGDAGCIVTNNDDYADKCRLIANHGRLNKYDHKIEGRNSRLDSIQAAILDVKLKHLPDWVKKRNRIAAIYDQEFKNIPDLFLTQKNNDIVHAYHLFVIRTFLRDDLKFFLEKNDINTGIHYPVSLPLLEPYKILNTNINFSKLNHGSELLSIPIGEHLNDSEVYYVTEAIKNFFS